MKILLFYSFLALTLLLPCVQQVRGQEKETVNIQHDLEILPSYKFIYEKYRDLASKHTKYEASRDSAYTVYLNQIAKIKHSPEVYLSFINQALADGTADVVKPSLKPYDYFDPVTSNPRFHMVLRSELYQIIKESLFERGDKQLPEKSPAYINANGDDRYKVIYE